MAGSGIKITADDKEFIKAIDRSEKAMDRFLDKVEKGARKSSEQKLLEFDGRNIKQQQLDVKESINIEKGALKELERQYKETRDRIDQTLGTQQNKGARNLSAQVGVNIELTKKGLRELEDSYHSNAIALAGVTEKTSSLRTQLYSVREAMANVDRGTDEGRIKYKALQEELKRLGITYKQIQTEQKTLVSGSAQLAGVMSGLQGLMGAYAVGQGAISMFITDNEKLLQIQTKLQAVMSIMIGLQQVTNTLNATSQFRIVTVRKVTELWAIAQNKVTIALGGSAIAAKVLMGVLTLGLSVAIGTVIALTSKWTAKQKELREEQKQAAEALKQQNEGIAASVAKTLVEYKKLQSTWKTLDGNSAKQTKFILDNKDAFKQLGISVNDVNSAESLFVNNEDTFVKSMLLRAKTAAAMELAAEKYKEALIKMIEAGNATPTDEERKQATPIVKYNLKQIRLDEIGNKVPKANRRELAEIIATEEKKVLDVIVAERQKADKAQAEALFKQGDKTVIAGLIHDNMKDDIEQFLGVVQIKEGGKEITKELNELAKAILKADTELQQDRLNAMHDGLTKELKALDIEHSQRVAKINENEKELAKLYAKEGNKLPADKANDFEEQRTIALEANLQDRANAQEKYSNIIRELEVKLLNDSLSDEERKQVAIKKTYEEYRKSIKQALDGGSIDEDEYSTLLVKINESETKESLDGILKEYASFQEKRLQLAQEYDDKIKTLQDNNSGGIYSSKIADIGKEKDKALADFDTSILGSTNLWMQLFDKFAHYSNKELRSIIDNAREVLEYVNSTPSDLIESRFGLSSEQLRNIKGNAETLNAIYSALADKLQESAKRNPFSALVNSFAALNKATKDLKIAEKELDTAQKAGDKEGIKNAGEKVQLLKGQIILTKSDLKNSAKEANTYLGQVGDSFQDIGRAIGDADIESFGKALSDLSGIAQGFIEGGWIGGSITAITTALVSIFSSNAKYRAALQQTKDDLKAFAHEYKMMLLDIELGGADVGIFGEDKFAEAIKNLKLISTLYDDYIARINKTTPSPNSFFGSSLKEMEAEAKGFVTDLQKIWVQTRHSTWFRSEKGFFLADKYPELFMGEDGFDVNAAKALLKSNNQLSKEAKRQLQEAIDIAEKLAEAKQAFKDYIGETFGELGTSLGDIIVDAFEDGTDAMHKWGDSFSNVLKNLAKQLMYTLFFKKAFEQLEKDLTVIYDNNGDDPNKIGEEVTKLLSKFFGGMGAKVDEGSDWYKNFVKMAEEYGFDLTGDAGRQGTSKGKATASQDSVDEQNGRLTVIQEHTYEININTKTLVEQGKKVKEQWDAQLKNSTQMLQHIIGIEYNTRAIPRMAEQLEIIATKGVLIR